ncbi:hypothetical protein SPI_05793 [Niveomyces insectorum RCEF 264]|uniref:DUF8021 domain-containing protein n=1 Tax=Niveomyces insectorum RCEF 264 TaxID=1081102 RepID=A0A167SG39_9HYPO|nr:hypothetical protein SPI_05793 [Niveomyces insectorum RCEF 264]
MLSPISRITAAACLLLATTRAAPVAETDPGATPAPCNQTALAAAADAYVAAQQAGRIALLLAVTAPNWTYVENNEPLPDVAAGGSLVSASDPANPYVIGTQIHHGGGDASASSPGAVVLVDSIVSTTNAWLFNATKTLQYVRQQNWTVLPEADRSSRAVLRAAGDAYLDMWSNATAAATVPWGRPCTRLEGSAYTGRGRPDDSCEAGIPTNHHQAPNTHRRYVIDEAMGTVSVFCLWEHMMNASDSHELRLEKGKLRYVHTMTVCGGKPCRL